jgi:hypothetical protein
MRLWGLYEHEVKRKANLHPFEGVMEKTRSYISQIFINLRCKWFFAQMLHFIWYVQPFLQRVQIRSIDFFLEVEYVTLFAHKLLSSSIFNTSDFVSTITTYWCCISFCPSFMVSPKTYSNKLKHPTFNHINTTIAIVSFYIYVFLMNWVNYPTNYLKKNIEWLLILAQHNLRRSQIDEKQFVSKRRPCNLFKNPFF